jgi:hypothetical protein
MTARLASRRCSADQGQPAVFASQACPSNTTPQRQSAVEVPNSPTPSRTPRRTIHRHRTFSKRREHERPACSDIEPTPPYGRRFLVLDAAPARNHSPVAFSTVASGPCACHQRVLHNTAPAPCYHDYCLACKLRLEARNPGWSSACHAVVASSWPQANFDRKWTPRQVQRACGCGVKQTVTSREVHRFELPRDQICRLLRSTNIGPPLPLPWCISVLSCIPSQTSGIRGRAEPGSLSLYSGPIIVEGDTDHATIVVALSLPMYLTVVPERHSDVSERQSSVSTRG